ncbi:DUF2397 family protein, partial [Ferrimicrobium sp.]|uniref:DUF2397 family protein n=1 Tax=Ferrimicrobium sp. TaxID=2926050 RepID=UPI002608F4B1
IHRAQKQALLADHVRSLRAREAACHELAAAATRLEDVCLSGGAMAVLVELFGSALASGDLKLDSEHPSFSYGKSTAADTGLELIVRPQINHTTTVHATTGSLTFIDLDLELTAVQGPAAPEQEVSNP